MKDINFLQKRNVTLNKQEVQDKKILRYALLAFSLAMISLVMGLGLNLYLSHKLKKINLNRKKLETQIASDEPIEVEYLFFVNKLKVIRELFDLRSDKQEAISFFTDLFGPGVSISGLNYEMEERILSLTITSQNIFILEQVFSKLNDPSIKKNFASVNHSDLRRSDKAEYSFKLTVTFKKDVLAESNPKSAPATK